MKSLHLDYRRSERPLTWLGLAILAAGIAATALCAVSYRNLADRLGTEKAQLEALEALPQRAVKLTPAAEESLSQQLARARDTARSLDVPWGDLFKAVEAADFKHVALLGLTPDPDKAVVKIFAEARNLKAMLEYVRLLEADPNLQDVVVAGHEIEEKDPEQPVRFSLTANWSRAP